MVVDGIFITILKATSVTLVVIMAMATCMAMANYIIMAID